MGCVFVGRDLKLNNQPIAIKFPRFDRFTDANLRQRWSREIEDLINLGPHTNVIRVRAKGVYEEIPYLVMDFCAGGSLNERLKNADGSMTADQVLGWLDRVADALDYLHRQVPKPIIHRDIKPANILFDGADNPIVTDFGIAKALDAPGITGTGLVIGTPEYMAPEAFNQDWAAPYDQYALATTVYQCLSGGRFPFEGNSGLALLNSKKEQQPKRLSVYAPKLRPELVDCVMKALKKDPAERFQSCTEFAKSFRIANTTPAPDPPRIPRWVLAVGAVFLVAVLLSYALVGPTTVEFSSSPPAMIVSAGKEGAMHLVLERVPRGRPLKFKISRPGYKTIENSITPQRWRWGITPVSLTLQPECLDSAASDSSDILTVKFDDAVSLETLNGLVRSAGFLKVVGANCSADAAVSGDEGLVLRDAGGERFAPTILPTAPDGIAQLTAGLQALLIRKNLAGVPGGGADIGVRLSSSPGSGTPEPVEVARIRVGENAYLYVRSTREPHVLAFSVDSGGAVTLLAPSAPGSLDSIPLNRWLLSSGASFPIQPPTGQLTVVALSSPVSWDAFLGAMEAPAIFQSAGPPVTWTTGGTPSSVAFAQELIRRLPAINGWSRAVQVVRID